MGDVDMNQITEISNFISMMNSSFNTVIVATPHTGRAEIVEYINQIINFNEDILNNDQDTLIIED